MMSSQTILRRQIIGWAAAAAIAMTPVIAQANYSRSDVKRIVVDVAEQYGIDVNAFLRMAQIESGFNPRAFHPTSKAAGLYQFIPRTARLYGLYNPFNARANAEAAAKLWRDNATGLELRLGRKPTPGELYLAHQQGLGGASKLLANPRRLAVSVVGAKAVTMNGGRLDMTAEEFSRLWIKKFE
jgi:hypothetical protein